MRGLWLVAMAACAHAPSASASDARWDYEVTYADGKLQVTARFPPGSGASFEVDRGFGKYVVSGAMPSGDRWVLHDCARGCTLRYDFDLANSSGAREVIPSTPDRWLARPVDRPKKGTKYRLKVVTPRTMRFVTGITPGSAPDTYEAHAADLDNGPYSAFGDLHTHTIGKVTLAYPRATFSAGLIEPWAERAVRGVAAYFGALPVPTATIIILPRSGSAVGFGSARGGGGAAVQLDVGRGVDRAGLDRDWVLVHELVHLGFPNLPSRQAWLEEGLATYVEPVIRARLGIRSEEQLWSELAANLPGGLRDGALNDSGSWASTYWGGAAFCFLADLMIRDRTGGKKSLADVLRAIVADGGNINESWSPRLVIQLADRATGVPVFAELWATLAEDHQPTLTVEAALARLGVRRKNGKEVELDDSAPWAAMRKSIGARF